MGVRGMGERNLQVGAWRFARERMCACVGVGVVVCWRRVDLAGASRWAHGESGEARGPRVCCDGETEMQSGVMRSGVVWVEGGGESRDSLPSQRRGAQSSAAFACVVSARASPWERAVRYPRVPE